VSLETRATAPLNDEAHNFAVHADWLLRDAKRCTTAAEVGPGRYRSPRHRVSPRHTMSDTARHVIGCRQLKKRGLNSADDVAGIVIMMAMS